MKSLPLLLKREFWEHRGGFLWTPVWITGVILAITVLGMITAEVVRQNVQVHAGISLSDLGRDLSAQDYEQAGRALDVAQVMLGALPCIGLFFVLFFYLLGNLYDDRRDRSVLFWKSLPVSDTATVASKALSAMLVAPLIAFIVSTLAYVVFLLLVGVWAALHGLNILPAIASSHPLRTFGHLLLTIPVDALWGLPAVGWLMFWSAWVRSKPFVWAVMLPVGAWFANTWIGALGAPNFGDALPVARIIGRLLLSIVPGSWMVSEVPGGPGEAIKHMIKPREDLAFFDVSHLAGVLGSANLWIGVIAGIALLAAATWVRGRRIEVNT